MNESPRVHISDYNTSKQKPLSQKEKRWSAIKKYWYMITLIIPVSVILSAALAYTTGDGAWMWTLALVFWVGIPVVDAILREDSFNPTAEQEIELQKEIIKRSLEKHIILLNPIYGDKKYNLYTQASLFVLPSYGENFGISIAEALSCSVPVITTNKTPWEDINMYNCGWYIDSSIDALNEAFEELQKLLETHFFQALLLLL